MLTAARGFCKLRKSWSKIRFRSETKLGRRRSAPGPENQIPIPWARKPNSYPSFLNPFRASAEGSGYSQSGSDTGPEFLGTGLPPGICPVTELPLAQAAAATAGKSAGGIHAPA